MNQKTGLIVASSILVLAVGVLTYGMGWLSSSPGSNVDVEQRCKKCGEVQNMAMSHVIKHGYQDPENGWFINCAKCGEAAPVRTAKSWSQQNDGADKPAQ